MYICSQYMSAHALAYAHMLDIDHEEPRGFNEIKDSSAVLLRVWSPVETLSGEFQLIG